MNIRTAPLPALALVLAPRALPGQASREPYRTSYTEATLPAGFAAPIVRVPEPAPPVAPSSR